MSRSYKHQPFCTDNGRSRVGKKLANRRVRREKGNISNGCSYKKVFQSCEISDYCFRETFNMFKMKREQERKDYMDGLLRYNPYNFYMGSDYMVWARMYKFK